MLLNGGTRRRVEAFCAQASAAGCVVVAKDDEVGDLSHELTTLIRICPISHDVPQAHILIDLFVREGSEDSVKRLYVGVDIRENPEAHGRALQSIR